MLSVQATKRSAANKDLEGRSWIKHVRLQRENVSRMNGKENTDITRLR